MVALALETNWDVVMGSVLAIVVVSGTASFRAASTSFRTDAWCYDSGVVSVTVAAVPTDMKSMARPTAATTMRSSDKIRTKTIYSG